MNVRILEKQEKESAPYTRCGPRPLGLYYALLHPLWLQLLDQFSLTNTNGSTTENSSISHFLEGVKKYHNAPWFREEEKQEPFWQKGRVCVYKTEKGTSQKTPILLIPSMINRSYIYNLIPDHSLVEHLCAKGYCVYLLDWGTPKEGEPPLSLDTAITDYIQEFLKDHVSKSIHIAGYCMGGLLALGAAQLYANKVKSLSLFATPWDFSQTTAHQTMTPVRTAYELMIDTFPIIPVDILQTQFVMIAPTATIQRFCKFKDETDKKAEQLMTLMEDWLADGIPLEQNIARTIAIDWFIENKTYLNAWEIAQTVISPKNITCPTFIAMPEKDILVPPASCTPLTQTKGENTVLSIPTGHIGLMVGRACREKFFTPFTTWLDSK